MTKLSTNIATIQWWFEDRSDANDDTFKVVNSIQFNEKPLCDSYKMLNTGQEPTFLTLSRNRESQEV